MVHLEWEALTPGGYGNVSTSPVKPLAEAHTAPSTSRSPLQTFIASHATPRYPSPTDPSSSRSYDRSASSTSSRKGKERAEDSATSRHSAEGSHPNGAMRSSFRSRSSSTPRRQSVELAPDDLAMFAQEAASLEVQGELDLDLEEESGDPPWDADVEESHVEEPPPVEEETVRDRTSSNRFSRILSRPTPSPPRRMALEDTSLPALPEPSYSSSDEQVNTVSSRQASLFRSPSKPLRKASPAKSSHRTTHTSSRHPAQLDIAPPEPIQVGLTHVSTPTRGNITLTAMPTPHPPGRWVSPARSTTPLKRSPLARVRDDSTVSAGDVSLHRLRISPSKAPAPMKAAVAKEEAAEEGHSSFLERIPGLSRIMGKGYVRPLNAGDELTVSPAIPPPSRAIQEAKDALASAAQSSSAARARVDATQRQFLEALAATQSVKSGAVAVARQGWTWSSWGWWVGMEVLLLWGVFR